ncbi:MAG: hypothetical protein LUH05_03420 [Candidatus Gastranaerophilales bacterium]|nr:hypothetical protein [Candidatus Gastranaerophilales bacterium]
MRLADKLKLFERQLVFLKWGTSEGYGRINYVGFDFIEFEIFDTDELEYTDKILINVQLIFEVVIKGSDIARILAEYSASLPAHDGDNV